MKYMALAVVLGGLFVAGCNKGADVTSTNADGTTSTVHVDNDGSKNITMTDGKGNKSTIGTDEVTEKDLGLPFYTGSTAKTNGNLKSDDADNTNFTSMRNTADAPSKVIDFYKAEFKKAGYETSGDMVSPEVGMVTGKKDKTTVSIMCGQDKQAGNGLFNVMVSVITKKK